MIFFFLSAQASRQVADYFIRWWTRDQFGKYLATCSGDCGSIYYVRWYAVLGLGFFIGLMLFRGAFLYLWTLGASERIREKSIHRILNAPLGFFLQVRCLVAVLPAQAALRLAAALAAAQGLRPGC